MTLRVVHLHGSAGLMFGKSFELDVSSLAEAVRAIGTQIKGFRHYVAQNFFKVVVRDKKRRKVLGEEDVGSLLSKGDIHIYPVVQGAKEGNGLMKVIAGVVIAAVAFWAAPAAMAGGLGAGIMGTGITYGQVAMLGLGLAATGLSQLLSKKPEGTKEEESFMLSGAINVTEQGGPVPLPYGRCRIGSVLISSGITTADIPIGEGD